MIVTALVLGADPARACALRAAERRRRVRAQLDRRRSSRRLRASRDRSPMRDAPDAIAAAGSRGRSIAAFHFGYGPVSYWIVLLLAVCTFSACWPSRVPRAREFTAQMLVLAGRDDRRVSGQRPVALRALLGSDAAPGVLADARLGRRAGGARRRTAAWRYLIYNFAGGLALLLRPPRSASSTARPT